VNIKELVENNDYVVIPDTNVLLNIYRYSPEFTEFALSCLNQIKAHIVLPATVRLEFAKHNRAEFAKMQDRAKHAGNETSDQIKRAKDKILGTCDHLSRLQFPDVHELRNTLSQKMDDVMKSLNDFFLDRSSLDLISHAWNNTDYVWDLVKYLDQSNFIMQSPSQEDIYLWCEDGEKRYKKEVPPGFKDAKNKDGVRKYSDLILWKEILRFATSKKKNIIFITDDVKTDWWEQSTGRKHFHSKLIDEFQKTGQQIIPTVSHDFYNHIATSYGILKTDAVELALRMTDDNYCRAIAEKVFDEITHELIYYGTDFVDTSNAHIGSEGIDEFEITECEYLSAERIDRNNEIITYHFKYQLILEGTSYDYWGRDEDTREIIRSPGVDHVFEGVVIVEVEREADIYLDFESDNDFISATIISSDLSETYFHDNWDILPGELGYCPDCGSPLDSENDGGNGFCIDCAPRH